MRVWRVASIVAIVATAGGCGSVMPPTLPPVVQTAVPATPVPAAPPIETAPPPSAPIRTVDSSGMACAGVGVVGGTLQGDASDPRVAWLDIKDVGTKGLLFPKGFTARFAPGIEIRDASGLVKFRAGDAITGGCVWGQGQDLLIGWP